MADSAYVAVTNIPSNVHAADLRAHFSSLVESNSFICFHFRHRPEKISGNNTANKACDIKRCCVVKVLKTKLENLLRLNGEHWTNVNGDIVYSECRVSQIQLKSSRETDGDPEAVDEEKLLQMPEFNPPKLMPHGNVGTPTLVFLDLIQQCLLPYNLISKLQLKFPKTAARRIYGNVNFDYELSDSHENTGSVDISSRYKYPGNSKLTLKPLSNYKPSSESEQKTIQGFLINRSSNCTLTQEICRGQSVMNTDADALSANSEGVLDSSNTYPEKQRSETFLGYTCLKDTISPFSGATMSALYQDISQSQSELTSRLSADKPINPSDKFLVPTALPLKVNSGKLTNRERRRLEREERHHIKKLKAENIEERLIAVEKRYHNDDDAEEWDRHEASEDDPSNQERNKERLYEEEIEQVWEKGGPGVVFYTDAVFWQEKEGDFDEQTTDDLDVDFSAYEEPGAGDKDIKDFLRIQQERRFRSGYDDTDRFSIGIGRKLQKPTSTFSSSTARIGAFEHHSKGIGRKVMERQGWKDGEGLGSSQLGIVTALKGEGQGPRSKRGLGYTDVTPAAYGSMKSKTSRSQPHLITTIYDDPKTTDPKEPLLQRSEPSTIKHRQSHMEMFS